MCWECLAACAWITVPFCRLCGDPVSGAVTGEYACTLCLDRTPDFDRARSAVRYVDPVSTILQQFKYGHATWLSRDLGVMLEACMRAQYAAIHLDAILYVPLAARKERERTYNQSRLLAQELGHRMRVPVAHRALRRTRYTTTQTHLRASERMANVRDAFKVCTPDWVEGRSLLLVDDVMTTGATVRECARVLKGAGAYRVFVVTVARG